MGKPSLLLFGQGSFSRVCFEHLLRNARPSFSEIAAVVPDMHCELAKLALGAGMQIMQAPRSLDGWLPEAPFDFGAVASFSHFLPAGLIDSFRIDVVNAHPSLLPKYAGAAPIQRAMLDGETATGISIIGLDKVKFDSGQVYAQRHVTVPDMVPYRQVEQLLAEESGIALAEVFSNWDRCRAGRRPQQGTRRMARKITVQDAFIEVQRSTRDAIVRRYLAIGHQEKLRSRLVKDHRTVIFVEFALDRPSPDICMAPGCGMLDRKGNVLWIATDDHGWIGVTQFRVEGKSSTYDAKAFFNGFGLVNYGHLFL